MSRTRRETGPCRRRAGGLVPALCGALLTLSGCRADMHDQPRLEPLESSPFFADGAGSRPGVENTVARGFLDEDDHLHRGRVNGAPTTTFPFPITEAILERGRERYDIYCAPCHGLAGYGNGAIVGQGFPPPSSLHSEYLAFATVGSMFEAITDGFGDMPDYAEEIPTRDRWAIVAYIRALQFSQYADVADLPQSDRGVLEAIP